MNDVYISIDGCQMPEWGYTVSREGFVSITWLGRTWMRFMVRRAVLRGRDAGLTIDGPHGRFTGRD